VRPLAYIVSTATLPSLYTMNTPGVDTPGPPCSAAMPPSAAAAPGASGGSGAVRGAGALSDTQCSECTARGRAVRSAPRSSGPGGRSRGQQSSCAAGGGTGGAAAAPAGPAAAVAA